ncbi:MAG: ATP-binding protein [Chloroflexi bacterium]|nr:ATP-binding protein [Chloroflexota bacterium]
MEKPRKKKITVSKTLRSKPVARRLPVRKTLKSQETRTTQGRSKPKSDKAPALGQRSKAKRSAQRKSKSQAARIAVSVHGIALEASDVEEIISRQFGPQRYASLCNAVSWATSGRQCQSLPSFTERVNAKDGGIDAEWDIDLPDDGASKSPLLGSGWNVFQYKQRDIFAQGRERTFKDLRSGLSGAVKDLYQATGKRPKRYILFTNIDVTHFTKGQKASLKTSILKGYDQPTKVRVKIIGAAELASLLNSLPHLRSAYFATDRFATWQDYKEMHTRQQAYKSPEAIVGRDNELATVRSLVDDSHIRVIILTGPQTIGKTRLALHATEHHPIDTVVALDPRSMTGSDLLKLTTPDRKTLVVVDGPDEDRAEEFVDQALASTSLKLVITLSNSGTAPTPSYGRDDRVQIVHVRPLDEIASRGLIAATGIRLDYSIESWIIDQAGGNPGILLLAASLGPELRKEATTLVDDVARAFHAKLSREIGDDAMRALRLLSMQTQVGIKKNAAQELESICRIMGEDVTVNAVLSSLDRLERAGVVRPSGSYIEVVPPSLANHLASAALRGRSAELLALFAALDQSGRSRLLQRLRGLKGDEVRSFWDEMFGPRGLLASLPAALSNTSLLQLVSSTVPVRVARMIEDGITGMTLEELRGISGLERFHLTESIQELLYRRVTSASALRSLALLAEAETESYSNNATGLFCNSFHAGHHQLPLPLTERLEILNEVCDPASLKERRVLGVKAIEHGLSRVGLGMPLHRGHGPDPLDAPAEFTWSELWNYNEAMLNLLVNLALADDPDVSAQAGRILPNALVTCAIPQRSDFAVTTFETIVGWVQDGNQRVSVANLIESIDATTKLFERSQGKLSEQLQKTVQTSMDELRQLANRIEDADYAVQLRRWLSGWDRLGWEKEVDEFGNQVSRSEKMVRSLAQKAVDNPRLLGDQELGWLISREAQRGDEFFLCLGRLDTDHRWLTTVERLGTTLEGAGRCAAYFGGAASADARFVSQRLEVLSNSGDVRAEAIILATRSLPGDAASVARVIRLIESERVTRTFAQQVLNYSHWRDSIRLDDYLQFLRVVGLPDLSNALLVIDSLNAWLQSGRQIDGDLGDYAWQCLSAARNVNINSTSDFDQVATYLAMNNIERGFELLEDVLAQPYENRCWQPIDEHGQNNFWKSLLQTDRRRALRIVLTLAQEGRLQGGLGLWNLRGMFDQEADQSVLVEFANANEQNATTVCELITNAQPGFWDIALPIFDRYPNSDRIKDILSMAIVPINRIFSGPYSTHVENAHKDVQRILAERRGSTATRTWLTETAEALRAQAEEQLLSESDRDTNEWRPMLSSADRIGREWAIGTLIRLRKINKALEVASRNELLGMIANLGLDEDLVEIIREQLRG